MFSLLFTIQRAITLRVLDKNTNSIFCIYYFVRLYILFRSPEIGECTTCIPKCAARDVESIHFRTFLFRHIITFDFAFPFLALLRNFLIAA